MHPIFLGDKDGNIKIRPLGYVRSPVKKPQTGGLTEIESEIILNKDCSPCLEGMEEFSHIVVIHWLDRITTYKEKVNPQGREDIPSTGVLATRSTDRPNPVGLTTVRLLACDGLSLKVKGLDVLDGTPVLDIKPYYPPYDMPVGEVCVPEYIYSLAY